MRRGRHVILGLVSVIAVAACSPLPSSGSPTASAPRTYGGQPAPSPLTITEVWVLSPVGLNLRSDAGTSAQAIGQVNWGERLVVSESRDVGGDRWLHVKRSTGEEGWVVARFKGEDTVATRAMSQHFADGGLYHNLFPADWALQKGNPSTFTAPPSDKSRSSMLIQTADDASKLQPTPLMPGKPVRDQGPVLVYGITEYFTIYQLDAGGFEFDLKMQASKTGYLFNFRQVGSQPDPAVFVMLLGTVVLTPAS
jgi:Bacterial SH3 domain